MLAQALTASLLGVQGVLVRVEVDVSFGLPGVTIVGLAGSAIQEARERVRSAIRNAGFDVPSRRVTVNLAPADLPKEGTSYDLAIAVAVLSASGQLGPLPNDTALFGELALDGRLQAVPGTMALVAAARDAGVSDVVVPAAVTEEAAAVGALNVRPATSLGEVVRHLAGVARLPVAHPPATLANGNVRSAPDLSVVIGQRLARRALEIAIAGRHSLALCGPPGVGKTLLMRCAPGLAPPLSDAESLEVSRIYSVAGLADRRRPVVRDRPFRAPHHTISTQALVGGGPRVRPGEASLAHRGMLFLDETLEFRADALDALRQPLESGAVTIARVDGVLELPARFTLLAAFNPCSCGWLGSSSQACACDAIAVRRYAGRLSGPLRDRLDLFVSMAPTHAYDRDGELSEATPPVASRIAGAWDRQLRRQGTANSEIRPECLDERSGFSATTRSTLATRARQLRLSTRRAHSIARVARTIADLEASDRVDPSHVDEAARYRSDPWAAAP
ncbi:MAG: YifB family Mg chelatase-like AAA ATPase [Candidatus Limnocylindria bacterium]